MRHAEAGWHINIDDHERPLSTSGIRDAKKIGSASGRIPSAKHDFLNSPIAKKQNPVQNAGSVSFPSKPFFNCGMICWHRTIGPAINCGKKEMYKA